MQTAQWLVLSVCWAAVSPLGSDFPGRLHDCLPSPLVTPSGATRGRAAARRGACQPQTAAVGPARRVLAPLRLRGGNVGPHAQLEPEVGDLLVHYATAEKPRPDHQCLRSALHRSRVKSWNGRRIYVSASSAVLKANDLKSNRYYWDKPIRIGTMKYGSGNATSVRVAGDDQTQIWGQWHFAGATTGIFQGLYCMYTNYGPYQPLMLIEKYASVLFQQCEIRNFGGKCVVMKTFSQLTLEWCTVGGSCGSRAPVHHKKFQMWRPELMHIAFHSKEAKKWLGKTTGAEREKRKWSLDLNKLWAPGGSKHASDGISVESGAWLVAKQVVFEDTGRAGGIALRAVGHSRVNLIKCRFQRNRIHLAADATAILDFRDCHTFFIDAAKEGTAGYSGELTNFHPHRALRLPGNGTSVLEAQEPTLDGHIEWRQVTKNRKYWTYDAGQRATDPNKQAKRIAQRAERKELKKKLKEKYEQMGIAKIPKKEVEILISQLPITLTK